MISEILLRLYGNLEQRLPYIGKTTGWLRLIRKKPERVKKKHLQVMKVEVETILEMIESELNS